jgi:glutamate racemase
MSDPRPIGVFDSGVGGLTVLQSLQEHLPHESTIYLGDLARCPYGVRGTAEIREFAIQVADLLAGEGIKLLVVACNTATAAAFQMLRDRYPFPVVGVVEPGARAAAAATRNGRIGVFATDSTVASQAYPKAVRSILPYAHVVQEAASWLVPVTEGGTTSHDEIASRLRPQIERLRPQSVDTIILGCTHFPLVRDVFEREAGPGIRIIDSALTTAGEVESVLQMFRKASDGPARHRLLVTGPPATFAERAMTMFHASPPIETIDLSAGKVA